jgi:putative intracellular protease/amidase
MSKILTALASHDRLSDTGRKTGFWLEEFAAPYDVCKDADETITVADWERFAIVDGRLITGQTLAAGRPFLQLIHSDVEVSR